MAKKKVAKPAAVKASKKSAAEGKTITKEIAQRYLKDHLVISRFQQLDDEAATLLGSGFGWLHLEGLTTLSDFAAASLAEHAGQVFTFPA